MNQAYPAGVALTAILCLMIGTVIGYSVHGSGLRGALALAVVLALSYVASIAAILLRSALWARRAALEAGVAAISFDIGQEVLLFEVTLVISGLVYAISLAAPERWGVEVPLAAAGGVCGLCAILIRLSQRTRTTETSG